MAQCIHAQLQLHSLEGAVTNCAVTRPLLIWHYSLLERQKTLLIKRVNRGLPAPSRFPPRFDIKLS